MTTLAKGSTDGSSYSDIGFFDYGSFRSNDGLRTQVDVTSGNYKYIKVLLKSVALVGSPGVDQDECAVGFYDVAVHPAYSEGQR